MPRPPASRRAALYGATAPENAPPGLAAHLLEFGEELRGEGDEPSLTAEALAERIGESLSSDDEL